MHWKKHRGFSLSRNRFPNKKSASQSFLARRRENKVKRAKFQDMCLEFCSYIGQVCAVGVRAARCKFPSINACFDRKLVEKSFSTSTTPYASEKA